MYFHCEPISACTNKIQENNKYFIEMLKMTDSRVRQMNES